MFTPISLSELEEWILRGESKLEGELLKFWNLIKVKPQKGKRKNMGMKVVDFGLLQFLELKLFTTMTLRRGLASLNMIL